MHAGTPEIEHSFKHGVIDFAAGSLGQYVFLFRNVNTSKCKRFDL